MRRFRCILALTAVLAVAGCSAEPAPPAQPEPSVGAPVPSASPTAPGAEPSPRAVGEAVAGLTAPWSMVAADGVGLVSERDSGRVLRIGADGATSVVGTVPGVVPGGEGGLMGLALAPDGSAVYAMLTAAGDNRVVRMGWDGTRLGAAQAVLTGIPKAQIHNGGRIAFGPDGMLYVATGDAAVPERAQDPRSLAGKILRVAPDGTAPADNPTTGSPVYSSGHRNVQGLAFDADGRLWASEFGAKDVDEVNLIVPGGNYGWPLVEGGGGAPRFRDPAATWSPTSLASPSGMAYAAGSLWIASLRGRTLYQVPLVQDSAGPPLPHLREAYGRLRDVARAPDGALWLLTNNTDGRGDPRPGDDRIVVLRLGP
jgi:glucose/arabinose dehydrogenase